MQQPFRPRLSAEFARLRDLCSSEHLSLQVLVDNMTSRSHALVTLIFALPFLLPVPVPGLSIIFGLIIALASGAIAIGKKPWVPKRFLSREVSTQFLRKVFGYGEKISRKLESIVKPRGTFILRHPGMTQFNGFLMMVCGLLLALPLPPGTNFPPATVILLLSIASLEEDILFMTFGYIAFVFNAIFFTGFFVFGVSGIKYIIGT